MIAGFPAPWTAPGAAPATARSLTYQVTPGYAEALGLRLRRGPAVHRRRSGRAARGRGSSTKSSRASTCRRSRSATGSSSSWIRAPCPIEIVGIVGNVLKDGNDRKPQPEMYVVPRDSGRFSGRFEARGARVGRRHGAGAGGARADPGAGADRGGRDRALSQRVAASVDQPRFATAVLGTFAILALALASVGLYGVLSYSVSQRRRELGVRAALGAAKPDLVRLVVREGLGATMTGARAGSGGRGSFLTRLMQSVLFGVSPLDLVAFAAAPTILIPIAVVACWLPARRAAQTDPIEALRSE